MKAKTEKNLLVALDIGTSKVVAIVGEINDQGTMDIVGVGLQPSRGLKKGVVVNIDATVQSIQRACEEAELMAGCEIHSVCTGISGSHIRSINSHGIVAIRDHEVTESDVERVIDAAKAVAIPADQKILHVLPQTYAVDDQTGIRDPIGMAGVRLESQVHMVTGSVSAAQNIVTCVRRCGLDVDDIVLEQLASSKAILTQDEKDLGVCILDIGGGTTDMIIFVDGAIRHTAVIPIAGDQVTNDIAMALRTPTQFAESLKKDYGCAMAKMMDEYAMLDINSVGERPIRQVSRKMLAQVIEARFEELFTLILQEIRRCGLQDSLTSGIVLTGGSSILPGLVALAGEVFHVPVRVGYPQHVSGLTDVVSNPMYATGVGLLLYALEDLSKEKPGLWVRQTHSILQKMQGWFQQSF